MAADDIQRGDRVVENWRFINRNSKDLRGAETQLRFHGDRLAKLERPDSDTAIAKLPFRVFSKPNSQRGSFEVNAWRIFYVQHGYVNNVFTEGCEDDDDEGTTPLEITVPDGTAAYFVWVDVTFVDGAVTASEIQHGEGPWAGFPAQPDSPDTFHVLLARIDTATRSTEKRAIVRQLVRSDILITSMGSGGDGRWA